ncbi:MAG: hypothetical protein LBR73_04620 [Oscillospiraceae bacterium]|jgi:hypothetical protein|nr:hypothetical protein [Oscillospiraceae bacterium]
MNGKTLIVTTNYRAYFFDALRAPIEINGSGYIYENIRSIIAVYDKVIFFNGVPTAFLLSAPFRENTRGNTFYFLWDAMPLPGSDCEWTPLPEQLEELKKFHTVYTFQPEDAIKFGLERNTTFYQPLPCPSHLSCIPWEELPADISFLGHIKNRYRLIRLLYRRLQAMGLCCAFRVFSPETAETAAETVYTENPPEVYTDSWCVTTEYLDYEFWLNQVFVSKAILDLNQEGQTGFSLRPMEAMFYGRKLISNNRELRFAPFYHPQNIFLLGMDSLTYLHDFLVSPPIPVPERIKQRYLPEAWASRFADIQKKQPFGCMKHGSHYITG